MILERPREPLRLSDLPEPEPGPGQVKIEVRACAVCRTDLHIVDGELIEPKLPLVPGHMIAGRVVSGGDRFEPGARVGVPWLGSTDGTCRYCTSGRENVGIYVKSSDGGSGWASKTHAPGYKNAIYYAKSITLSGLASSRAVAAYMTP